MSNGRPLSPFEIEKIKHGGDGFTGEQKQEKIALAAPRFFREELKRQHPPEITVLDATGTQEYFRLGDETEHIPGAHVHAPDAIWDEEKGWNAGPLRATGKHLPLVKETERCGFYVSTLLKALEQGHYRVGSKRKAGRSPA
jgi:hypothetical protein